MHDLSLSVIRRYDMQSKQLVTVAGIGASAFSGDAGPATAAAMGGGSLAFSPDGTLYVADTVNNRIRQITTTGTISTVAGTGTSALPTAGAAATATTVKMPSTSSGLAFDLAGNLTAAMDHQIWKFAIGGTMSVVAGTGTLGASGDGGAATAATVNAPRAIAYSSSGDLYIVDGGNHAIRRVRSGTITTVAGTLASSGNTGDGAAATSATLNGPKGITIDVAGTIYITDSGNNSLRYFTDGGNIATVTGSTSASWSAVMATANAADIYASAAASYRLHREFGGAQTTISNTVANTHLFAGDGLNAMQTQYDIVSSDSPLIVDSAGDLVVSETNSSRMRKITTTTGISNGLGTVNNAAGFALDPSGNLVYSEYSQCNVKRLNSNLTTTVLAGTGTCSTSGDGGAATSATINNPQGIAMDSAGNLYIAEANGNRVRKVDTSGNISTIAGTGTSGLSGDGGPGTAAQLNSPRDVTLDRSGNVVILDNNNNRVRVVDRSGMITTLAGTTSGTTGDGGLATAAKMQNLRGLAVDADNNLFISESNRIRKVDASTGIISTAAGSTTCSYVDNTTASSATFCAARITLDSSGNMFVSEVANHRVRKISGLAATATNNISSATWSIVPGNTGHANLRERFVVTPSATTTSSKMTFTVPASFAGTPTVVENYGLTGSVTASISGTTLTVAFPSQTITAGVQIAISVEGITNGGSNGAYASNTTLYDSAGTTAIGWARTSIVNITASGAPTSSDAGYGSVYLKVSSISASTSTAAVTVTPTSATQTTSMTFTTSGNLNGNSFAVGATSLTRSQTPAASFSGVTANISTGAAAASFAGETWGSSMSSTSGTVQGGANAAGNYVGNTASPQTFVTGASATNTYTLGLGAKSDWLLPAGIYVTTLTYQLVPGS